MSEYNDIHEVDNSYGKGFKLTVNEKFGKTL